MRPEQFPINQELLQLSVEGERYWDEAWSKFKAGLSDGIALDLAPARAPRRRSGCRSSSCVAFYAVIAVAFGNQNTLSEPVPFWNPLDWNVGYVLETLENIWHGGQFLTVFVRTFAYVAIALALSLLIGYPVAYFAARHAGRWKRAPAPAPDPARSGSTT